MYDLSIEVVFSGTSPLIVKKSPSYFIYALPPSSNIPHFKSVLAIPFGLSMVAIMPSKVPPDEGRVIRPLSGLVIVILKMSSSEINEILTLIYGSSRLGAIVSYI